MEIRELVWLEAVVTKIESKHRVMPQEVEEVFNSHPKIKKMLRGRFRGEHVYRALGKTEAGRYVTVFFIYKRPGKALILSAREMDRKERRIYATR